jgi:hypothetical protein
VWLLYEQGLTFDDMSAAEPDALHIRREGREAFCDIALASLDIVQRQSFDETLSAAGRHAHTTAMVCQISR